MFTLVYMYHTYISIIHLLWIITSFIVDMRTTFLIGIYSMIPLLTWEFILVYGSRIPIVNETDFFVAYGAYFKFNMVSQTYEQTFIFLNLVLFFMMISCRRILEKSDTSNGLLKFF